MFFFKIIQHLITKIVIYKYNNIINIIINKKINIQKWEHVLYAKKVNKLNCRIYRNGYAYLKGHSKLRVLVQGKPKKSTQFSFFIWQPHNVKRIYEEVYLYRKISIIGNDGHCEL